MSFRRARCEYNHVNTAIGTFLPGVGFALGVGDYLGQKYEPFFKHQVTEGGLNNFVGGSLNMIGFETSPFEE